jgi:hypothetical protein
MGLLRLAHVTEGWKNEKLNCCYSFNDFSFCASLFSPTFSKLLPKKKGKEVFGLFSSS